MNRINMLPPRQVPAETAFAAWPMRAAMWEAASVAAHLPAVSTQHKLTEVTRFIGQIPIGPIIPVTDGENDDLLHDAYFHVTRINGDPAAILVQMAATARAILLQEIDEAVTLISTSMLGMIDRALTDFLACMLGREVGNLPVVDEWNSRTDRRDVMPRWIRGHQIFAALTQGLLLSFGAMGRAVRAGNSEEVRRWADLTISLLRGSGASFVLTGDFSVENYNDQVRPSMMPPASPICLSGLMSVDHRVLVQLIRDLKPALKSLHDQDPKRHEQIHEELKTVYDRHIHVCERFVGKRPSLLTAGSTEKSGPALIEQFKTLRLKAFESPNHVKRLKTEPLKPTAVTAVATSAPATTKPADKCPFHAELKRPERSETQP